MGLYDFLRDGKCFARFLVRGWLSSDLAVAARCPPRPWGPSVAGPSVVIVRLQAKGAPRGRAFVRGGAWRGCDNLTS
jgi:hypothetical protein